MTRDLRPNIRAAYDRSQGLAVDEDVEREVMAEFKIAVGKTIATRLIRFIEKKFENDQQAALALGLRDRSSLAHMRRSLSVSFPTLSAILGQFPSALEPATVQIATKSGYAAAMSYLRRELRKNSRELTLDEFDCMLEILCTERWDSANGQERNLLGLDALRGVERKTGKRIRIKRVADVEKLVETWAELFFRCLEIIPRETGE